MEDTVAKPSGLSKLLDTIIRPSEKVEDLIDEPTYGIAINAVHRYQITVRTKVVSFHDAVAAADGLKKGEQQILNLNYVQPELREKIKDFLCGVKHISEGDWVELGEKCLPPFSRIRIRRDRRV